MSSPRSLWDGFFVMLVGIILSVLFMATLGQIGDRFITTLIDCGMTAMNSDWAESFESVYIIQTFLFISCCLPGLFGIAVFILAAVRRQRYDTFTDGSQMPQIDFTRGFK